MIEAIIFDLDGTLVQTEKLKALSYARAAVELCPYSVSEDTVIAAFKDVVGLSRQEVAQQLIERFSLQEKAEARRAELGVSSAWQAFVQVRLKHYEAILANPETLRDNQWAHTVGLLNMVNEQGCKTALATMSHCEQVVRVLGILGLQDAFDFVATRDDVEHGKPNPEIYELVMQELSVKPENTLIIEDSPAGVEAALNANADVIAVSTPFTKERLHALERLPTDRLVDEPDRLMTVVARVFGEHKTK